MVASKINQYTGLSESSIKTIIKLEKCEVWVSDGNVKKRCDREALFDAPLTSQRKLIEELQYAVDKYLRCLEDSAKCEKLFIDKSVIEDFCKNSLIPDLKKYMVESGCMVSEKDNFNGVGVSYYVIDSIKTKGYVISGKFENFSIAFDVRRDDGQSAIGAISIDGYYGGKSIFNDAVHPEVHKNSIKKLKDGDLNGEEMIKRKELEVSKQFENYLKRVQRSK